jgi:hypothetical protein
LRQAFSSIDLDKVTFLPIAIDGEQRDPNGGRGRGHVLFPHDPD